MITWKPKDNGHFASLYKDKLKKKGFLDLDIKKIFENSKDVLSKSIDPNTKENYGRLSSKNIVLGYIQSGKTTSMEAVSCMARDNGFKLIILLRYLRFNDILTLFIISYLLTLKSKLISFFLKLISRELSLIKSLT